MEIGSSSGGFFSIGLAMLRWARPSDGPHQSLGGRPGWIYCWIGEEVEGPEGSRMMDGGTVY